MNRIDWIHKRKWRKLIEFENAWYQIPQKAGVYVISAGKNIHRTVGVDKVGIIDIGETVNLRNRIKSFLYCAKGEKKKGHMAGWRYHHLPYSKYFPIESLLIQWKEIDDKDSARKEESRLMDVYVREHLELPPLNYSFNWSKK